MGPELVDLARKYVWWDEPERTLRRRELFLCQLMQLGTFEDVHGVRRLLGDEAFKDALERAPPGVLDPSSWSYWHLFFGLPVPPMPSRPLP